MKKLLIYLSILFCSNTSIGIAQEPLFDKLEQLYSQGHYKMVHRKAKRLLKKEKYNYSYIPSYYTALSKIQLSSNKYWLKRNPNALQEASERIIEIKKDSKGNKLINAHINEIAGLKKDILNWYAVNPSMKLIGIKTKAELDHIMAILFKGIILPEITSSTTKVNHKTNNKLSRNRKSIINEANKHLGTPYVWGGTSPNGFDCSGFTQYVYLKKGIKIPRIAKDQYSTAKKIKEKSVKTGDLIFFSNSSKISHVGIVYSVNNNKLEMIHASSSKGIIITDIKTSNYWKKRLKGFGRYINN
mgnify:CR=1 FL=1